MDRCEPFVSDCAIRLATDLLTHRWDPVVLAALRAGPQRRSGLLAAIGDVSDKSLTDALRRLVGSGLVERGQHPAAYRLTELGESFVGGPLAALGTWAVAHGHRVVEPGSAPPDVAG